MVKTKKFKIIVCCLFIIAAYNTIQFLKIKRIEDYSQILFKASSQKDQAFSILLGDYILRNKSKYSWNEFGNMEEYFLYLDLHPSKPDYTRLKELLYLAKDQSYPDRSENIKKSIFDSVEITK
ncbi:hypothetical protein MJH12_07145 [bacterium]|nr:hypothetical protein [bacterium]